MSSVLCISYSFVSQCRFTTYKDASESKFLVPLLEQCGDSQCDCWLHMTPQTQMELIQAKEFISSFLISAKKVNISDFLKMNIRLENTANSSSNSYISTGDDMVSIKSGCSEYGVAFERPSGYQWRRTHVQPLPCTELTRTSGTNFCANLLWNSYIQVNIAPSREFATISRSFCRNDQFLYRWM